MTSTTHAEVAIYLRKSRDEEQSGTAETLARHRAVLMGMVETLKFVLLDVYEEVVSGESLYARPEMLKLLEAVQSDKYDAVLCMDIDRLGRGGMSNQGMILDAFKFSDTQIITPEKVYDLADETDEQMLEFKTFMSRQEYRQIQKRLRRGLKQTIAEGGYTANAPYGYQKTKIDKKPSLEIYEPEARFVRLAFEMYCNGTGAQAIAAKLNTLGSVPHRTNRWSRNTVRNMLNNHTYTGKVVWLKKQHIRPGKRNNSKHIVVYNPPEKWEIYDGLHEPIIAEAQFNMAQRIRQTRYHPPSNDGTIKSSLAGLAICARCGRRMQRMGMNKGVAYLMCNTVACSAGAKYEYVEAAILQILKEKVTELDIRLMAHHDPTPIDYTAAFNALNENVARLNAQKEKLYDFLEQGVYSVVEYRDRMQTITDKLAATDDERSRLVNERKLVSRGQLIILKKQILKILEAYSDSDVAERNTLLRSVIDAIIYTKAKKTAPRDFSLELQYNSDFL